MLGIMSLSGIITSWCSLQSYDVSWQYNIWRLIKLWLSDLHLKAIEIVCATEPTIKNRILKTKTYSESNRGCRNKTEQQRECNVNHHRCWCSIFKMVQIWNVYCKGIVWVFWQVTGEKWKWYPHYNIFSTLCSLKYMLNTA